MTTTRTLKSTTDARIRLEHGAFESAEGPAVNDTITVRLPDGSNVRITVTKSEICGRPSTFGNIFTHGLDNGVVDYVLATFSDCGKE